MIHQFDSAIISFVDSWPDSFAGLMHMLSFVGQPAITITILLLIGAYGLYKRKYFFVNSSFAALIVFAINSVIKLVVHRQRPPLYIAPDNLLYSYSFPSGHSAGTVLAYGLLAYILCRKFSNIYARIAVIAGTIILAFGVGLSRIYLGDHYPTDVLAGWAIGAAGLAVILWKIK